MDLLNLKNSKLVWIFFKKKVKMLQPLCTKKKLHTPFRELFHGLKERYVFHEQFVSH